MQLLSEALTKLRDGDIRGIAAGAGRLLVDAASPSADTGVRVDASGTRRYYAHERGPSITTYCRLLDDETFTAEPGYETDAIELSLLNADGGGECTVRATFDGPDGEVTERLTFVDGIWNERPEHPFRIETDAPARRVTVSLDTSDEDLNDDAGNVQNGAPALSDPTCRPAEPTTAPVVVVSIDSLRYDAIDRVQPLIEEIGAVVPDEPRTQGVATWQAHGSMFTGVHPSQHGCHVKPPQLAENLVTLPEVLSKTGYRCSGLVASANLSPEIGWGRGFDRFEHRDMDWERRDQDAHTSVGRLLNWIDADYRHGDLQSFYFIHLNDAHYPYYPPPELAADDRIDYQEMEELIDAFWSTQDYLELVDEDPLPIEEATVERAREHYERSLHYVADQVRRLTNRLDSMGVLDDTLLIVTGDHGEDFYEYGTLFHRSLYGPNIKPGMFVKPPRNGSVTVPDDPDIVDILPTAARVAGVRVPEQCVGQAWTESYESTPRVTETVRADPADRYQVSVECSGWKVIYTYEGDAPDRPGQARIDQGPLLTEYFETDGTYGTAQTKSDCPRETRDRLRRIAETHVLDDAGANRPVKRDGAELSRAVRERLSELGYRELTEE